MNAVQARTNHRPAYTLIELLAVMAILVVLVSLTTAGVMRFRDTGPRAATRSNVATLKTNLDAQWKAVRERAERENIPSAIRASIQAGFGTDSGDPRIRARYVELKLAQAFPTSFAEALTPGSGVPAWQPYSMALSALGVTPANAASYASAETQMAVCLMLIVERGPNSLNITPDSLGPTGALPLALGTSGKQAPGCVDGWGRPLLFTRSGGQPSLLSAGADGKYGVNYSTFAITTPSEANDNVSPARN